MSNTPGHGNRRAFLKTSAVAAGVLASELAFNSNLYAEGNDVIKIGLVGCGGRGTGAAGDCLEQADPNLKLVAIGDAFKDRALSCLNNLKDVQAKIDVGDRIFVGLDAYEKVMDQCDLVILATPPGFRPLHLQAAVAKGKHIFTEKPVCVDGPGFQKVMAAYEEAKNKKLCIGAGTQRRHENSYLETMKRIHGGDIGDIVAARCYWNQGSLWHKNREPGQSDLAWQLRNWLYFTWLSGDHITEQHVHNLDVMNWATRAHPLKAVGLGGRQVRTGPEFGQIYDHFAVDYEYPNGVHVASQCRQQEKTADNVSEAVVGTRGSWTSQGQVISGEKAWRYGRRGDISPYKQEHIDLIKAIRDGKVYNELKTVAESSLTAVMGRLACYTGQQVSWDQAVNSQLNLFPANLSWEMSLPVAEVAMPGKTKLI
jgi:myo-inositol 2-dehydrogenase / D-chiro-inositol 1-dehydrogenase